MVNTLHISWPPPVHRPTHSHCSKYSSSCVAGVRHCITALTSSSSSSTRSSTSNSTSNTSAYSSNRIGRAVQTHASASSAYPGPDGWTGSSSEQSSFLSAFWRFLRPHTIRGTISGTTAVVSKVLLTNSQAIDWALLPRALMGLLALLCGNGYIVGINQIYDVDIDGADKPFLGSHR